jgi:integrase
LQSLTRFSEFLAQERPKTTAKAITRKLLLEYLSYLPKRVCIAVRKTDVINVRAFLEIAARERWLPIGSERMIYDEEVPQPPKPQPRYIPSAVLDQLNRHLGNLKAPWMQMILIFQECGMRISELLQLPLDCLTQDARGTPYLRFMQGKMKREHTIPVSQEIARVIQEQQQIVRGRPQLSTLLFPNPRGKVFKQFTFAQRINRLAYDHEIRDANGKLFRFQSHQFRHTVGTRMINLGVPHHIIQRYLGHLGPEMTSRYAQIHDTTMKEKLSEYLQGTLVDVTGKTVPETGPLDTGDLQWFTRNVLAQALTNGYCAIPVVAGPCPHPNACLNCAHFRTDISFLEVHKAELRETERVIAKANANGWVRQIEMNERKRNNLFNIITSLEQTHA